jgi:hypothetical protein
MFEYKFALFACWNLADLADFFKKNTVEWLANLPDNFEPTEYILDPCLRLHIRLRSCLVAKIWRRQN